MIISPHQKAAKSVRFKSGESSDYDYESAKEPGLNGKLRNRRSVWSINTQAYPEAHFATFPTKLIEPCILASSKPGDYVLDPFFGSGTVGVVCLEHQRRYVGIELHPEYVAMAARKLSATEERIIKVAI